MLLDPEIEEIIRRPGTLVFPSNLAALSLLPSNSAPAIRQPSGHLVVYGKHGRRLLATDPDGHPLHECEWQVVDGALRLLRARLHLDWGAWVGLAPGGLVNSMTLDLSRKAGWERLGADDLRGMAAKAMQVPLDEVRFFYNDQDMTIDAKGAATIRHRKDALYVLPDGTFDRKQFMACMGAMHWEDIDFLPVVELFLSLLPGTGSAMFELIRGLYDDQNLGRPAPRPLRYRGIPTYPSKAAYRLFSGFFDPQVSGGGDPFPVFMDPPRSHLVTWLPAADPPRRHFDPTHQLCVTIRGQQIIKATCGNDSAGLSYQPCDQRGTAPCQRGLAVDQEHLVLMDRERRQAIPFRHNWGKVTEPQSVGTSARSFLDWTSVFEGNPPSVSHAEAFGAVLLYPEDDREIGELATQPFVADYLQDVIDQDRRLALHVGRAESLLISGFDVAIASCIGSDRPRSCTVLYDHPAFAQRQAQLLWNTWAGAQRLDWLPHVRMRSRVEPGTAESTQRYDLVYEWLPFSVYEQSDAAIERMRWLAQKLAPGAIAFVVGPQAVADGCRAAEMRVQAITPVAKLPTFRMHQTILPRSQLKKGIMLYEIAQH